MLISTCPDILLCSGGEHDDNKASVSLAGIILKHRQLDAVVLIELMTQIL